MGVKISKRYSSYKSQLKAFKIVLNFLPNGPHKTTFAKFYTQIWHVRKMTCILETAARRAKRSSISTPWVRKKVSV